MCVCVCVLLEYVRRSENSPIIFLIFSSRACVIFLGGVGIFIQRRAVNPNRHFLEESVPSVRQSVKSQLSKVTTKKNFQKSQQRAQKTLSILSVLKDELLDDQRRLSRKKKKKKKKKKRRRRKRRCVTNTTSARRKDADEATKGEEEEEEEVPREC